MPIAGALEAFDPAAEAAGGLRGLEGVDELERRFEDFVAAYRDRAVSIAWRLLGGDGAAAEDVAQEAFARAHRGLGRFRDDAKLSTWFYRILVNEVRREQRRWILRRRRDADTGEPDAHPDPRSENGAARPDPALRRRIGRALERLPRGQRETFVLVHLEELTLSEAAASTGRALGTAKSHLHRALRALRAELADLAPSERDPNRTEQS